MISFLSISALVAGALALPTSSPLAKRNACAAPRLVQYVQTFHTPDNQPLSLLPLLNDDTGVTHVNLAAIHVNGPGEITLNDASPNDTTWDQMWSDVATLQQGGIKVLFMMGGAAAGSYGNLCGSSVPAVIVSTRSDVQEEQESDSSKDESVYGPLLSTIQYHNIDGLDLDIEEEVDISCPLALLDRLNSDLGCDFLLTMAPVGAALVPNNNNPSGFDYPTMDAQANDANRPNGKLVNWYNAQFYNGWGDASSDAQYKQFIASGNWDPSRVNLGVLDNSGDGSAGYVSQSQLTDVVVQLCTDYSTFGGVAAWEWFDAGKADGDANPWQWDQDISDALYDGVATAASSKVKRSGAITEVPWPEEHSVLLQNGVSHFDAVKALNQTSGDLPQAMHKLNIN